MANEANDVAFQLKHIDILHFIVTTQSPNGVMAQLVARLNGIQKVRGSNPLGSTKNIVHFVRYFLFEDRGFHDFIVMLLCNTNPCGLMLHFASKLARFAITEVSKIHFLRIPYGLTASKERRKRVAFAEIVRSGHSKQTKHAVSRAMRGGATAPFV